MHHSYKHTGLSFYTQWMQRGLGQISLENLDNLNFLNVQKSVKIINKSPAFILKYKQKAIKKESKSKQKTSEKQTKSRKKQKKSRKKVNKK